MEVYNANPVKTLRLGDVLSDTMTLLRAKCIRSCEDEKTNYLEMPDGLRLVFRDGEYAGWYLPGEVAE